LRRYADIAKSIKIVYFFYHNFSSIANPKFVDVAYQQTQPKPIFDMSEFQSDEQESKKQRTEENQWRRERKNKKNHFYEGNHNKK